VNVVVDTNIVFSALLSPKGAISDLLFNSAGILDFYSPTFLLEELENHHQKLLNLSRFSEEDLSYLKRMVLKKIELIDLALVSDSIWKAAMDMTNPIDEFDAPFVALSLALESTLWTGDKKLLMGLRQQEVDWVLNTANLKEIRDKH